MASCKAEQLIVLTQSEDREEEKNEKWFNIIFCMCCDLFEDFIFTELCSPPRRHHRYKAAAAAELNGSQLRLLDVIYDKFAAV